MGRPRPSRCRNCWSCSGETVPLSPSPPPRIVKAGSPGTIQNRANTMTVANSSVGIKSSTRRMAYLPIQRSRLRLVAREWGVGVPPEMFEVLNDLFRTGDMEVLESVVHHASGISPGERHHVALPLLQNFHRLFEYADT